jgi:hypothetical protein
LWKNIYQKIKREEKNMINKNRERDIAILMEDRCTKREAEEFLRKGTTVYEDPKEYIQSLKDCGCYEGQTLEQIRNGEPSDVTLIDYKGHAPEVTKAER